MIPLLPQNDPNVDQRLTELATAKLTYQYNYTYFSPIAMVDKVPSSDNFPIPYFIKVAKQLLNLILNGIATALPEKKEEFKASHNVFWGTST